MRVIAAGQLQDLSFDISGHTLSDLGWTNETWVFTATGQTTTLEFDSHDPQASSYGPTLDNIIVSGAPGADTSNGGGSIFRRPTTCETCLPINLATGNFWHSFTDISIPGRSFPLQLSRTYNARLSNQAKTLGYGWTHNYDWYIERDASN